MSRVVGCMGSCVSGVTAGLGQWVAELLSNWGCGVTGVAGSLSSWGHLGNGVTGVWGHWGLGSLGLQVQWGSLGCEFNGVAVLLVLLGPWGSQDH